MPPCTRGAGTSVLGTPAHDHPRMSPHRRQHPVIVWTLDPLNVTVPVPAVKVPLFVQLPARPMLKVLAASVVDTPIVRLPVTVTAPARVFVKAPPLVFRLP